LPWDYELAPGETLWEALVRRYDRGVAEVEDMQRRWSGLEGFVDAERFQKTAELLAVQRREAQWWRDACIAYFQSISGLPLPRGVTPPEHPLEHYLAIDNRYAPG
jgi:alpha-glucuronidase